MRIASIVLAAGLIPLWAQEIKLPPGLEKLSDKAEHSVDVTMSKSMLQMAARFLSDRDGDGAKTRKLVGGLEGVTVRSFEFAREGEYNLADVDALRTQLQAPAWSRIVGVRSRTGDENFDLYFKTTPSGQLGGVVLISAQPTQLTIVNVTGNIDPDQLGDLGGQFGIPQFNVGGWSMGKRGAR
ncbi:MAG TPA: DUF4252 domain-containing protein [Bryobacteraceae bacterium]|jgi:hypothetical protein